MKSAKSLGFCFKQGKEKNKTKRFCCVHGGKQTPVCSRTVHSSTVSNNPTQTFELNNKHSENII
jgi:hypothetical protein